MHRQPLCDSQPCIPHTGQQGSGAHRGRHTWSCACQHHCREPSWASAAASAAASTATATAAARAAGLCLWLCLLPLALALCLPLSLCSTAAATAAAACSLLLLARSAAAAAAAAARAAASSEAGPMAQLGSHGWRHSQGEEDLDAAANGCQSTLLASIIGRGRCCRACSCGAALRRGGLRGRGEVLQSIQAKPCTCTCACASLCACPSGSSCSS